LSGSCGGQITNGIHCSAGHDVPDDDLLVSIPESLGRKLDEVFDISTGKRAYFDEATASILLKQLLHRGHFYHKVCFSNWSFGIEATKVAAHVLKAMKSNLREVDLSDIVAGRPEGEALMVMAILSSALEGSCLTSLNLSDNALGEKGVRAFSTLLKSQTSLQALYFMNSGISEDAARAICELLPSAQEIRILHFHNNMTGDAGAEVLAELVKRSPNLEDFQFSSSRVGIEGGIALAESLQSCKMLRRIDVHDNMFGPDGGFALAKMLRMHTQLAEVYLSDLGLEDDGTVAVAEALANGATYLRVLELGGNEITAKAVSAIAACVQSLKFLTRLNLAENELKDKGAVVVCQALISGHEALKELDLSENMLGSIGAVAAAQAVAGKTGFGLLNLNRNHISKTGLGAICKVLAKCTQEPSVLGPLDENDEDGDEEDVQDEVDEEYEEEEDWECPCCIVHRHFENLQIV
jgi:Ran GTPase-activating protein 1